MAHATAHGHDLPCPRPAPLLVFVAVLATTYLALTRLPAAAPLAALIAPHPEPGDRDSCAGFYGGAGALGRAVSASVEDFGAVGDGVTSNTAAFRRAVAALEERARAAGGGGGARLEVPPGRWLTGSFNLTSRFTLFLHDGAVILGSQDPQEWPLVAPLPSYGRGRERLGPRHISLIHGEGLNDVVITGNNGTIDGQGKMWWELWWNRTLNHTRGHLIELVNSTNILLSNITLRNSPFWTDGHRSTAGSATCNEGLTILAPLNAQTLTGSRSDSSSEVLFEDCYIEKCVTMLVAVKSGWDQFGSEMSGGIYNVLVRDLHVWNSAISGEAQDPM
ncbi:hypothetical protein EJB05_10300, partial [Eragrostis curvula]